MAEKKFKTAAQLAGAWRRYKKYCDEYTVTRRTEEDGRVRVTVISSPLTYTIDGFCVFEGITRQVFYRNYSKVEPFCHVFERMRDECEVDARVKFETGRIPSKLAPLWMGRYGYSSKPSEVEPDSDIVRFEDL